LWKTGASPRSFQWHCGVPVKDGDEWKSTQLIVFLVKTFFRRKGLFTYLVKGNLYYRHERSSTAMETLYSYVTFWSHLITWKKLSALKYWKLRSSVRYMISLASYFLYTPYQFSESSQIKETFLQNKWHIMKKRAGHLEHFTGIRKTKTFFILSLCIL